MYKVYFSPGEDCLTAIINNLKKAEKEVRIYTFTISNNRISNVIRQLYEKCITVKIISDNRKVFDRRSKPLSIPVPKYFRILLK